MTKEKLRHMRNMRKIVYIMKTQLKLPYTSPRKRMVIKRKQNKSLKIIVAEWKSKVLQLLKQKDLKCNKKKRFLRLLQIWQKKKKKRKFLTENKLLTEIGRKK